MAAAVEGALGARLTRGIVVTKHGHLLGKFRRCFAIEAAHPVPDASSVAASSAVRQLLQELNARDLLITAVSGGASALLTASVPGVSLADKQKATELLLRAGASIDELNTVRKHLSVLKGGGLVSLAYPATVTGLLLSDVIGDSFDIIGSGLTAPDPSTFENATTVLDKYKLRPRMPRAVLEYLDAGLKNSVPETPKPGSPVFKNVHNVVVGSNRLALHAAAATAQDLGYRSLILSSTLYGESREVARVLAQVLREIDRAGHPLRRPACILAGGETTVTVKGAGKGGRNQEFALAAAIDIAGLTDVAVLSAGTDGTDGPTDAAGAIATGDTVKRAVHRGLEASRHLAANDAHPFFEALGDLVKTGPTGTNVMDIHILLAG
jgi:hydroxypyruvate reductase